MRYSAELTSGALKLHESRIIADLLLQEVDPMQWEHAIFNENILQLRSMKTAKRISSLLRRRLSSMKPPLWKLIREGNLVTATHACLAATVKSSYLLGDFLDYVLREEYRTFGVALTNRHWDEYLELCQNRDPEMTAYTEATRNRLRSSVYQILAQAGYLENTRTRKLQQIHIDRQVLAYLHNEEENYVLKCIQVSR